jgi:CheY-like chemotaxis protein
MGDVRRNVLIVEDDESLRLIVARHLRAQRYDVDEAGSVEEATTALEGGLRPDVVLLDLNLPGDTGWGLLRDLWLAGAGSPPVVITSATAVNPKQLAQFGCAGYLAKPFPLETLVAALERVLTSDAKEEQA